MIKLPGSVLCSFAAVLASLFASTQTFAADTVWLDDALPGGSYGFAGGGDVWNWTSSSPSPYSGKLAHQSSQGNGLHEHYFSGASVTMNPKVGDVLFSYVYLDPANPPSEIMLEWYDGTWNHRAYWGNNSISYGQNDTPERRYMGSLPTAGQWVRLEIPASSVNLENSVISGMGFSLYNGRATWDRAGVNTPDGQVVVAGETSWIDDALPAGAVTATTGNDSWNWVTANPKPFSGASAHQSTVSQGVHEHYFSGATSTLNPKTGDTLFAYVYLDPVNTPSEIMLQWNDGSWEHRAYWGNNTILYGTSDTVGRRYMGSLPTAGQWIRLEVPAGSVGLDGKTVNGMAFSQVNGRATWDRAGNYTPGVTVITLPTLSVVATDSSATIGSTTDTATFTFTRTGATTDALTVSFTLSGTAVKWNDYRRPEGDMPASVTIPAGASSATLTLNAIANITNSNPETVILSLASDAAYTVGNPGSSTVTLLAASTTGAGSGTTTGTVAGARGAVPRPHRQQVAPQRAVRRQAPSPTRRWTTPV